MYKTLWESRLERSSSLLPGAGTTPSVALQPWPSRILRLARRAIVMILAVLCTITLALLIRPYASTSGFPPTFAEWHAYEHSILLPVSFNTSRSYIYFENHVTGVGWGNVMQELLLNAHLAHASGWGYVFDNYTWSRDMSSEYAQFNGRAIPARIPLSALVMGHAIGGSAEDGGIISLEAYKMFCPDPFVLRTEGTLESLGPRDKVDGEALLKAWVAELQRLASDGVKCVTLPYGSATIFDLPFFESPNVLSLFPHLQSSPILQNFAWSPLVLKAFIDNEHLFSSPSSWTPHLFHKPIITLLPTSTLPYPLIPFHPDPSTLYKSIPGLLVLHIRRGDFEQYCHTLAASNASFIAFNNLPELSASAFNPPSDQLSYTMRRCYPSIPQILERLDIDLWRGITRVYIMSNGSPGWLAELSSALKARNRGLTVFTSRDLVFERREEKVVAHAMDMYVAEQAEVFLGNGFSSLTSNIVLLRAVDGRNPEKTMLL